MELLRILSQLHSFRKFPLNMESSSYHCLNSEENLNPIQRFLYWVLNYINNSFPNLNVDSNIEIREFKMEDLERYREIIYPNNSPSRMLQELFWARFPWIKAKQELEDLNLLSTGCGSGNYAFKLIKYSNDNISKFYGVDLFKHDNWKKLVKERNLFFKFFQCDSANISKCIPEGTNFFMTQSAIEHFNKDLSYFKQIRDYIKSTKKNIIQVHLFPSRIGLHLYHFHGVRQYTPRTISRITRLFNDFSYIILFKLGGDFGNYLHYKYLTLYNKRNNQNLRDMNPEKYQKLLYLAIKRDMKYSQKQPAFYALLIHSNWKEKIF